MNTIEPITCADGFSMSVQASRSHYSTPKSDDAPSYTHVECGFPSEEEPMLSPYAERMEGRPPTELIYAYVPSDVVETIIKRHGGISKGSVPRGISIFTQHDDGDDVAYFGLILLDDGGGRCYVKTPYFVNKTDANNYTMRLCSSNQEYAKPNFNILYQLGTWSNQ
jgi:hypothetical protein